MIKYLLLPTLLALSGSALAQVYKCVGPDGTVSFSNNPFCEHRQAYARDRDEPLLTVKPEELAKEPPGKIMEILSPTVDLAELLEQVGRFAGIALEPMALEGNPVKIQRTSHHWLELFNELVTAYDLDYRQAYGRLYVYQEGTMGETIVHSPTLLRWYQSDDTWNAVMRNDDILLRMKAYEQSTLQERLPRLLRMVRDELGEKEAVNEAESVVVRTNNSGGVGSSIIARGSEEEQVRRAAEDKARRITERRQSN